MKRIAYSFCAIVMSAVICLVGLNEAIVSQPISDSKVKDNGTTAQAPLASTLTDGEPEEPAEEAELIYEMEGFDWVMTSDGAQKIYASSGNYYENGKTYTIEMSLAFYRDHNVMGTQLYFNGGLWFFSMDNAGKIYFLQENDKKSSAIGKIEPETTRLTEEMQTFYFVFSFYDGENDGWVKVYDQNGEMITSQSWGKITAQKMNFQNRLFVLRACSYDDLGWQGSVSIGGLKIYSGDAAPTPSM